MNAPVVQHRETFKPEFPAVVLTYTDALKALANSGGTLSIAQLAERTNRVVSNLRRDSQKLRDADVITRSGEDWTLTDKGRRWLLGQDVASGALDVNNGVAAPVVAPPAGFVALTAGEIAFDADNARQTSGLSPLDIEEMAASIREHGLLTPPIVRDRGNYMIKWGLVAGERRLRGWQLAIERGWIAADNRYLCQIFEGDDTEATEAALVENLQRVDLDNLEAAEGLRKLSDKSDPPATAATIARRLGKEERWVEQRLKVAREASEANKDRYRAFLRRQQAEDFVLAADPDPFRWTDLRNSVQKPKHLTALEKNPRLAMLVVELAMASEIGGGIWDGESPFPGFSSAPIPLAKDLGLVEIWTPSGDPATINLTQLACDWLASEGFGESEEDRDALLLRVRVAALGPVGAAALPGQYATDFLDQPPQPDAAPVILGLDPRTDRSPTLRPGLTGDELSLQIRALREDAGEEGSEDGARSSSDPDHSPAQLPPPGSSPGQAEQGDPAADEAAHVILGLDPRTDPAPQPPPPAEAGAGSNVLDQLTPLGRLALLELAHAVSTRGVTARGGAIRGAPIYDFHNHQAGSWGELFRAKLAHPMQGGPGWIGVLTPAAEDALALAYPEGIGGGLLSAVRIELGAAAPPYLGAFASPWLNPPKSPEPGSPPPPPVAPPEGELSPPQAAAEGVNPGQPPAGDPIIGGLRSAAADLWHAASEARAIFNELFDQEQSTEQMEAVARRLQSAQFALAPYLTPEQKAAR